MIKDNLTKEIGNVEFTRYKDGDFGIEIWAERNWITKFLDPAQIEELVEFLTEVEKETK